MRKRRVNFMAILAILAGLVTACEEKHRPSQKSMESSGYEEERTQLSIEEWHALLNSQKMMELTFKEEEKEQIAQILNHKQSEYRKMPYSGDIVSSELVSRLEEALYSYCKFGEDRSDQPYQELLKELGGGSFRMSKEEIQKTFSGNLPDEAFTFLLNNGKRLYLKSHWLEGGSASCYVWSKKGDEWVREGDFTAYFTQGEVIYDGDTYYYIGLEEEGIWLFRLREQMEVWKDKLSIRYIPENYRRIPLFLAEEESAEAAADYISGLDTASVLSKKTDFCGEAEEPVFQEETGSIEYSRTDMTNTGIPIYMKKKHTRNNVHDQLCLEVDFYLYNETEHQFVLLENWKDSYSEELRREYLWCEEFGGKVYTFQLFRLKDYAYLFEVLLLEGEEKTILQREVWIPERQIHFKQG